MQFPLQVSTIFWWGNLNRNIETASGGGSIDNTPGVAFQEKSSGAVLWKEDIDIPKSKRSLVQPSTEKNLSSVKINSKVSRPSFVGKNTSPTRNHSQKVCEKLLMTWKSVRYLNTNNKKPQFVGWIVEKDPKSTQRSNNDDVLATNFKTDRSPSIQQSLKCFMSHGSCITLDVGAAIKVFRVIWNNPVAWSDIVIHLRDFHTMLAYFGMMGLYVSGRGLGEVLFQADLCSSGSIRGVISGKHYNRCWKIH